MVGCWKPGWNGCFQNLSAGCWISYPGFVQPAPGWVSITDFHLTNRLHFPVCVCVYSNWPQMTSQRRAKNKKSMTRDEVEWRDCCFLHAVSVTSSVVYYSTHTWNNVIYLFSIIKIQIEGFLGHENRKTSQLTWSDVFDATCVCMSFINRSRSTTNGNAHRNHVIV